MGLCTPFRSFTKIQCETVSAEVGSTKLHRDDLEGEPGGEPSWQALGRPESLEWRKSRARPLVESDSERGSCGHRGPEFDVQGL